MKIRLKVIVNMELTIERNPSFRGVLFQLIKGSGTECISTDETCLPPFTLIIVSHLNQTMMKTKEEKLALVQVVVFPDPCNPTNMMTLDLPFFGLYGSA